MMYLVFLSILYVAHGGGLIDFIRLVLGYNEEEQPVRGWARLKHRLLHRGMDYAHVPRSVGGGGDAEPQEQDLDRPDLPLMKGARFAVSEGGGTFRTSFGRVDGGNNDGEHAHELSHTMSLNRDLIGSSSGLQGVAEEEDDDGESMFLSKDERNLLKRRTVTSRLQPLVILSSFVSDLDLVTDWVFLYTVLVDFPVALQRAGLVFAISGSIMWALSTTEFALLSQLKLLWRGNNPMSRIRYTGLGWQLLLNVVIEDLPQFIIIVITKPVSIPGALNIATSLFSLMSKIVKGISSTSKPSLATQFTMIDVNPAVTRNLFKLADEAKSKAKKAEKLVNLAWIYRCAQGNSKGASVFRVMQLDPTFVDGDLAYMRVDLITGSRLVLPGCEINGHIPPELGWYNLTNLVLRKNFLGGSIPRELGHLSRLQELDLSDNELTGEIPQELFVLTSLEALILDGNSLTGDIPSGLGMLTSLEKLNLGGNRVTGPIPEEIAGLAELTLLDLSNNSLVGPIPPGFSELCELESLRLQGNKLTGDIPLGLGKLERIRELNIKDNRFRGADWAAEELELLLHPECRTSVLPQEEPEEELDEEVV